MKQERSRRFSVRLRDTRMHARREGGREGEEGRETLREREERETGEREREEREREERERERN